MTSKTTAVIISRSAEVAAPLSAILLGMFLLLGVGFLHSGTIHDAAHDTRHAFSFPCH